MSRRREVLEGMLRALPADIPDPELWVDDDGDIDLDWDIGRRRVMSLGIRASGSIGFAYLLDAEKSHGTFAVERNGALPDSIVSLIRAVCDGARRG